MESMESVVEKNGTSLSLLSRFKANQVFEILVVNGL